jgi:hypothetical protein
MPEPIFMNLGMYIMAPEPILTAYFINPFHQSVCVPKLVAFLKARRSLRGIRGDPASALPRTIGSLWALKSLPSPCIQFCRSQPRGQRSANHAFTSHCLLYSPSDIPEDGNYSVVYLLLLILFEMQQRPVVGGFADKLEGILKETVVANSRQYLHILSELKLKLSLCLIIKHYAVKMYGGVEV